MSLGTIQINGQKLSTLEIEDICKSLQANGVRCLSLRECTTTDKLYEKLMNGLSCCKSILQLNLNLGLVKNFNRVKQLCYALFQNRSLKALFLHGSCLGSNGMQILVKTLAVHPNIVSLDVGDCQITDASLSFLAELLPPNGAKRGLQDLTLSGNSSVTQNGWVKFFIALAASSTLRKLYLDYTDIGDLGVSCLAVALASNKCLEMLDLEGAGIEEHGAQTLLHLVKSYPVTLTDIVLSENPIKENTKDAIYLCLQENEEKRRTSTVDSKRIAAAMQDDSSDASTVKENITESSLTLHSATTDTQTSGSYALSTVGSESTIQNNNEDTDDEDLIVIPNQSHVVKQNAPPSRALPQFTHNQANISHTGGYTSTIKSSDASGIANSEIVTDSDDDDDDMGTLLVGQTLPGYYANPLRIGGNVHQNVSVGGFDKLHTQDAVRQAYADALL